MAETNVGRTMRREDVVVKGIKEVVNRRSEHKKTCDACPQTILPGDSYFRVTYSDKSKPLEMFHEGCFIDEFTDLAR